ncbi:hypothetical protein L596_025817 [Steinernema carpocapsae]|uniref:Uncharacterized protein n=1 Tax=Steinernema carpocapsae TaxID=34508 RepID=A0A4U5M8W4_STECR|nr:hypothetical protein L596_025817 [Steinernema carpocapsae]
MASGATLMSTQRKIAIREPRALSPKALVPKIRVIDQEQDYASIEYRVSSIGPFLGIEYRSIDYRVLKKASSIEYRVFLDAQLDTGSRCDQLTASNCCDKGQHDSAFTEAPRKASKNDFLRLENQKCQPSTKKERSSVKLDNRIEYRIKYRGKRGIAALIVRTGTQITANPCTHSTKHFARQQASIHLGEDIAACTRVIYGALDLFWQGWLIIFISIRGSIAVQIIIVSVRGLRHCCSYSSNLD